MMIIFGSKLPYYKKVLYECHFSSRLSLVMLRKHTNYKYKSSIWYLLLSNHAVLFFFQSVIFHVETHPKYRTFRQCVTFNFFPSHNHELAYNLFNLITLYALPLLIITTSYSLILWEISKKTKQCKGKYIKTLQR